MGRKKIGFVLLWVLSGLLACQKEKEKVNAVDLNVVLPTQVAYIMHDSYLWAAHARAQNVNPLDYDARSLHSLITELRAPEDRFTFLLTKADAIVLQGMRDDLGLMMRYLDDTLWVAFVEPGSPADQVGLRRGQWIKSLPQPEGKKLITTPPPDPFPLSGSLQPTGEGSKRVYTWYTPGSVEIGERGNSALKAVNLSASFYDVQAVDTTAVINVAGKKVGYIHFTTFFGTATIDALTQAFLDFKKKQVTDLIMDLRYNRGGDLYIAQHLLDAMHNPGQRTIMYKQAYNEAYASKLDTVMYFAHNPDALNPENIYFLVDITTASASELLINTLKPLTNTHVFLVGKTTLGKNVGSNLFWLPEAHNYTHAFAPITFRLVNKDSEANYEQGFAPDYQTFDGLHYELGDKREAMLAAALYHVEHGTFPVPPVHVRSFHPVAQPIISTRSLDRLNLGLIAKELKAPGPGH